MIEFTTVVGLDLKHLEQFKLTWPTWARHRPEIRAAPLLAFCDVTLIEPLYWWEEQVKEITGRDNHLKVVPVQGPPPGGWSGQREKMLNGFVLTAPFCVDTEWMLKIDTDSISLHPDPSWIQEELFLGNPPWVASPWSYTKPAHQMSDLDDWADGVEELKKYPRLNLPFEHGANKVRHKRMASWVCFYNADFARFIASLVRSEGRLPAPSHDGFVWFVAARMGLEGRRVSFKKRGWANRTSMRGIAEAVAEAMA